MILYVNISIYMINYRKWKTIYFLYSKPLPFYTSQIFHMNNAQIHSCAGCFIFIHVIFLSDGEEEAMYN